MRVAVRLGPGDVRGPAVHRRGHGDRARTRRQDERAYERGEQRKGSEQEAHPLTVGRRAACVILRAGPRAPEPAFTPVASFADGGDPAQGRELGRDIRFVQVQTEHDAEPRVEGRAYLYFWPGGGTERASIQITRPGDLDGLTILVDALTGRARLRRGRIELEEARRDVDFQEREEQ